MGVINTEPKRTRGYHNQGFSTCPYGKGNCPTVTPLASLISPSQGLLYPQLASTLYNGLPVHTLYKLLICLLQIAKQWPLQDIHLFPYWDKILLTGHGSRYLHHPYKRQPPELSYQQGSGLPLVGFGDVKIPDCLASWTALQAILCEHQNSDIIFLIVQHSNSFSTIIPFPHQLH